jgi:hypothetical protein
VDADKQLEWVDCMKPIHGIGLEPVVAVETVRDLIKGAATIDAIPVEWLLQNAQQPTATTGNPYGFVIEAWREEQEAQDE